MVTYPLLQWDYLVTEVGVHKAASKGPGKQVAARGATCCQYTHQRNTPPHPKQSTSKNILVWFVCVLGEGGLV